MIIFVLVLAAADGGAAVTSPPTEIVKAAEAAIKGDRLDQARLMIERATAAGSSGPAIDRLVADLAFASGDYQRAVAGYKRLPIDSLGDWCESAAIAALKSVALDDAKTFVACATRSSGAGWRSWNAAGALADWMRNWAAADAAFAKASASGAHAEVLNNVGWSHLLRGEWAIAHRYFEQAVALDPASIRISNNLELADAAFGVDLPARRAGEDNRAWAARLNDAGVVAELAGQRQRAVEAFTQALYASGKWYARAANNLERARNP